MEGHERQIQEEIDNLQQEIEHFKKEKERVKSIVGRISGVPTFNIKVFNFVFAIFVLICLVVSLMSGETLRLAMVELAITAISFKLIYLMHSQSRVTHFQMWVLTSPEWRINEIMKTIGMDKA